MRCVLCQRGLPGEGIRGVLETPCQRSAAEPAGDCPRNPWRCRLPSVLLCRRFAAPGPFWGRQYLFWRDGRPLTLIYEVFSPALEEFLGPARQARQAR